MSLDFLPTDIIEQVKQGKSIPKGHLPAMLSAYIKDEIPEYQVAALLMAIYFKGLLPENLSELTAAVRNSGHCFEWKSLRGKGKPLVDKHSTGGVGDKVSLIVVPLVVELGMLNPMMSGRSLGHTGGTVDKLQSIPGFDMFLAHPKKEEVLAEIGACMFCQSDDVCPIDQRLYALRDVTATVDTLSLITPSIVAKKWAEGVEAIVYDVKFGSGAFMKDLSSAKQLGHSLIEASRSAGMKASAMLTRMDEPLGSRIGNALEVEESLWILKNKFPNEQQEKLSKPLAFLCAQMAAQMAVVSGVSQNYEESLEHSLSFLESGKGYETFARLCRAQGAKENALDELPQAAFQQDICASSDGYIQSIDSLVIGKAGLRIGVGRLKNTDPIDPRAGFELLAGVGDKVSKGDGLIRVFHSNEDEIQAPLKNKLENAFVIGSKQHKAKPLLEEILN